jgi:predicted DNA-binding transcriptional regulator AlpA
MTTVDNSSVDDHGQDRVRDLACVPSPLEEPIQADTQTPALSLPEVTSRSVLRKSTIYALMRDGRFPHCKISARGVRWLEHEIEQFLRGPNDDRG